MKCAKHLALLLACLAAVGVALAQAPGPKLGRLFATPEERAALDAKRNGAAPGAASTAPAPAPAAAETPPAAPAPLILNGVVRRSSGKSTAWINQVPQNDRENSFPTAAPVLSVRSSSGKQVLLKPGQRYEHDAVKDAHEP